MNGKNWIRLARALLACVVLSGAAQATTLVRMDLDELAAAAGTIARVRCLGSEVGAEGGEIWTFTRFEVMETLKGAPPREVTVRLLGGRLGGLVSTVDGVPRFREGEEAYLFLEPTPVGDWTVTSWVQGTFRVERDSLKREVVTQDTSGLAVFDPSTRQFRPGGIRRLPVDEFRQRVRAAVEKQRRNQQ
jgi:hypothetical protein